MTPYGRSSSLSGIFSRKKNTYGMISPEEFEPIPRSNSNPEPRTRRPPMSPRYHRNAHNDSGNDNTKDCFAPSEMDTWELPQYQSLFHHLISQTQDRKFRRRLSSTSSTSASIEKFNLRRQESSPADVSKPGPIQSLQRWFKEFIQSMKNDSDSGDDEELDPNAVVEAIPIEICEKLRYIHVYF